MIEKNYIFKNANERFIEQIIDDENVVINHMILVKDTSLPEHYSNSNVYMIIVRGRMSIKLDEQEMKEYEAGNILVIPYQTKMLVMNKHEKTLEFFVVKAPNPKDMKK